MKRILIASTLVLGLFGGSLTANAQGLGGLLKKGKQALEKGNKIAEKVLGTTQTNNTEQEAQVPSVDVNGITVINPIASSIVVEPVGLYGVSRTETKGNVYLVMKVTMKEDKETAAFGSSIKNKKMIAADGNGNVYNIDSSGAMRYDTPPDMTVKIVMDDPQMMFEGVDKSLTMMPMVKIGVNIDAYHQDNLTFKNVPIFWDVEPE